MPPKSRGEFSGRGARGVSSQPSTTRRTRQRPDVVNGDDSEGSSVLITGTRTRTRTNHGVGRGRIRGRGGSRRADKVPDIYEDMLAEAVMSEPNQARDEGRKTKRRRVGDATVGERGHVGGELKGSEVESVVEISNGHDDNRTLQQIAYKDFEESEESDVDWEEVDISKENDKAMFDFGDDDDEEDMTGDLNLILDDSNGMQKTKSAGIKRKPITAVERQHRLEMHKMHLLCLLTHVWLRNCWCNDENVQAALRPLLNDKTVSFLNPDPKRSQFQHTNMFIEGLSQASALWNNRFKITARGLKRAVWTEDENKLKNFRLPEDIDLPIEKADFQNLARTQEGSRDVGAQLFCALLRSAGVEARLVCSLQPLPFNSIMGARDKTLQRQRRYETIYAADDSQGNTSEDTGSVNVAMLRESAGTAFGPVHGTAVPLVPKSARRLWQVDPSIERQDLGEPPPDPKVTKLKRIKESAYPIYWVEAFNVAQQKWISVDPLVTRSVGKPSKFEPPTSDAGNSMSYVVAFEDEGTAKDVTRRYTKAFNAKTRKMRVESTKGGSRWWRKSFKIYQNGFHFDRDQVEDAELAQREASEEMPRNVQDFKDHPYYALERHLRKNEVIHPKREVGKVTTGPGLKGKAVEPIYRRSDVYQLKSADGWYRVGREIKPGEQPLKHVQRRRNNPRRGYDDEHDEDGDGYIALYAAFQTVVYEPPPVVNGRVPKNMYGNLDVYFPSMVPKGAVHLPCPDASRAARLLALPYVDAVTGFSFRGRHGTAVIRGIVVAEEYANAVRAVIQGLQDEKEEDESIKRSRRALTYWKRWLIGLRIRERVQGYGGLENEMEEAPVMEEAQEVFEGTSGFHPERYEEVWLNDSKRNGRSQQKGKRKTRTRDSELDDVTEEANSHPGGLDDSVDDYDKCAGGFIPEDNYVTGGFIREEHDAHSGGYATGGEFVPGNPEGKAGLALDDNAINDEHELNEGGGLLPSEGEEYLDETVSESHERQSESAGVLIASIPATASDEDETGCGTFEEEDILMGDQSLSRVSPAQGNISDEINSVRIATSSLSSHFTTVNWSTLPLPIQTTARPPLDMNIAGQREIDTMRATDVRSNDGDSKEVGDHKWSNEGDSDHESLLSHDPEDDDAEPEWLLSD